MPGSGGRWSIVLSPCCASACSDWRWATRTFNDHSALRHDLALQTAAERDCALASPSTLSRFENAAGRDWAWNIHEVLVEDFIASHSEAPEELILDFDATDDAVHGRQVGRFFHGYYDHYCLSGRALARAPVGGGFPAPPFRLRGGFTVPPLATFPAAPPKIPDIGFSPVRLQASGTSQFGVEPSADASGLRPTQPYS